MPIEPVYEKLSAREKIGETVSQIKVDCKTDVPAEEVEKILNENAFSVVTVGEIKNGRAEFVGKTTFFICYRTADGIKKCECGAEIRDSLNSELISEGDYLKLFWETDKTEVDLSGLKMSASAYLTVKGEIFRKKEYSALKGGEGLHCKFSEAETVKFYGNVSGTYHAEEEFDLPFGVSEVLSHRAEACVTAVQCGVGTIICDGEIYLTEILLQSGEKKDIIRENRVIPFRAEVECEDAMPQFSAACRAYIKSLKTDVAVDENKNVSTVTAQVVLGLCGEAYSFSETSFATDVFSTESQLELTTCKAVFAVEGEPTGTFVRISGRTPLEQIDGARIVAVASEKAEVVSAVKTDKGVSVTGAAAFNILFSDADGGLFSRKAEIPFETTVNDIGNGKIRAEITPKCATARLVSSTEMECEAEAVITLFEGRETVAEFVSAAEAGEPKAENTAAVSVYIPLAGEGLWELSKRLNVAPETLIATNGDLQFPLTGKERIAVYRQK